MIFIDLNSGDEHALSLLLQQVMRKSTAKQDNNEHPNLVFPAFIYVK